MEDEIRGSNSGLSVMTLTSSRLGWDMYSVHKLSLLWQTFDQSLMKILSSVNEIWRGHEIPGSII